MNPHPSPSSVDPLLWWREARFGLFIHWGLYAVHGGVWKGRVLPGIGEWLMCNFKVPVAEYRELAKHFNPADFDAEAIAQLAKDAGMRYLVITAKHHDGFAMWDSKVSDYTIVKATPYARDPMKDLAAACARRGIVFCFYYSQALDWEHPDGVGNTWDFDETKKNFQRYLDGKVKPQLTELLTGYGPIGLIWFDTPVGITRAQSMEIRNLVKSLQPNCLVSGRIGHGVGDYGSLGDNQIPAGRLVGDWETPATMNDTWGYKTGDRAWKSVDTLQRLLIDLSSKGANYLLNIGPDAQGRVPVESVNHLRAIGAWLRVHGEAVYGTQPNPFPYEFSWGRMTRKADKLYVFLTDPPRDKFRLHGLRNEVRSARLLGSEEPLTVEQRHNRDADFHALSVTLPSPLHAHPHPPAVLELTLDGPADVNEGCIQQPDGSVYLPGHMAELQISAESAARRVPVDRNSVFASEAVEFVEQTVGDHVRIGGGGLVENWRSTLDALRWTFSIEQPVSFAVHLHTVAAKYKDWAGGHRVILQSGGCTLTATVTPDEEVHTPRTHHFAERVTHLGTITFATSGTHTVHLGATHINPDDPAGLCVGEIRLVPRAP
jgi:alpha-L-fucosidase